MKLFKQKKGQAFQIADLPALGIAIGVGILTLSFVALILQNVRAGQTLNNADYNVSTDGLTTITNTSTNLPTVGTVIGAVIIIGTLLAAFRFSRR